ncbi:helix-turn-helix domain-containing protein [Paenibacillus sp. GCM10027626]|uniref:helix-turn-helix domain-containing protein n=1 Tax=Paenibacillus sp. GCM10027626 TaxID=3273411 RepID=UPI0036288EC1
MLDSGLELDVYKAFSADEAIDWLQRTKMDIVITDIRMPGMSGLQLLTLIKERWPHCKVILLTGHNAFDYVYEAIRYDGVRYLLKTEGYDAILELVRAAIAEIDEAHRKADLIATADHQMKLALPMLHKEMLSGLLRGGRITAERRISRFGQLDFPLDAQRGVRLLLARMEISGETADENAFRFDLAIERYMGGKYSKAFLIWEDRTLIWLLQPAPSTPEQPDEDSETCQLKGNLELALETCEETFGVSAHFLLDDRRAKWEEVADRFAALRKEIASLPAVGGKGSIAGYAAALSPVPKARAHDMALLQVKKLDLLASLLESGQKTAFSELLEEMLSSAERPVAADFPQAALGIYYPLSLMLLAHVQGWKMEEQLTELLEPDLQLVYNPALAPARAGEAFRTFTDLLFEWRQHEQDSRVNSVILFVQSYVQEHLEQDLSLVRLAEVSRLNPSYLSRLFKRVTGINLNVYIQEARLNKAAELLRESDYKIYEIARMAGYEYPPYFTKIFRKSLGMSPQQYRDLHAGNVLTGSEGAGGNSSASIIQ